MKVQAPGSQSLEGLLHKSNMSPDLKDVAALKHEVRREVDHRWILMVLTCPDYQCSKLVLETFGGMAILHL